MENNGKELSFRFQNVYCSTVGVMPFERIGVLPSTSFPIHHSHSSSQSTLYVDRRNQHIHIIRKCLFVAWMVRDRSLLRDFEPQGILFMSVCFFITVATVLLLKDFESYVVMFMSTCAYCFRFSLHS
jgi:hypothetical protein